MVDRTAKDIDTTQSLEQMLCRRNNVLAIFRGRLKFCEEYYLFSVNRCVFCMVCKYAQNAVVVGSGRDSTRTQLGSLHRSHAGIIAGREGLTSSPVWLGAL